jgi:hypothetical protein
VDPQPSNTLYRVQTGAFKVKTYAEKLAAELKGKGFDTYIVQVGGYYKVQVGAYKVKANAAAMEAKLKAAGYDAFITTNGNSTATAPQEPAATPKKTVAELAREVIQGKWGNGAARKQRLTAAGYDYAAVQAEVNRLLK